MKNCPTCNTQLEDNAVFCHNCGARQGEQQAGGFYQASADNQNSYQYQQPGGYAPQYQHAYEPYDHTAEFDAADISENKVLCMLVYLMSVMGIIVALLAGKDSKYLAFHVRQALKISVVEILIGIITLLLAWTVIVPFVGAIALVVLFIVKLLCFFQICSGKAKEPAIIRSLSFLK